jgi:hypothetical protein
MNGADRDGQLCRVHFALPEVSAHPSILGHSEPFGMRASAVMHAAMSGI